MGAKLLSKEIFKYVGIMAEIHLEGGGALFTWKKLSFHEVSELKLQKKKLLRNLALLET